MPDETQMERPEHWGPDCRCGHPTHFHDERGCQVCHCPALKCPTESPHRVRIRYVVTCDQCGDIAEVGTIGEGSRLADEHVRR